MKIRILMGNDCMPTDLSVFADSCLLASTL